VVTIQVTWLHSSPSWQTGSIAKLPDAFAPPAQIGTPFAKQNSAQTEAAAELRVTAAGQIMWANLGGPQGTGLMNASITYHVK
jgi:hypothetical protein